MKPSPLAAGLVLLAAVASAPAVADDDAERARRLTPEVLAGVLAGYEAYRMDDAAAAIAAWLPVAEVAPHRVQYQLAALLAGGAGGLADLDQAAAILEESLDHGHAEAQYWRGTIAVAAGEAVGAAAWLGLAAEQGLAEAQFELGLLLESGTAGDPDYAAAAAWYLVAAEGGMVRAQNNLGVIYAAGHVAAEADGRGAEYWLETAARQGLADAQFNLGALYERGAEGDPDGVLAFAWLSAATRQGHREARAAAEALSALLTPAELAQAGALLNSGALLPPTE